MIFISIEQWKSICSSYKRSVLRQTGTQKEELRERAEGTRDIQAQIYREPIPKIYLNLLIQRKFDSITILWHCCCRRCCFCWCCVCVCLCLCTLFENSMGHICSKRIESITILCLFESIFIRTYWIRYTAKSKVNPWSTSVPFALNLWIDGIVTINHTLSTLLNKNKFFFHENDECLLSVFFPLIIFMLDKAIECILHTETDGCIWSIWIIAWKKNQNEFLNEDLLKWK